ncbi:MAG: hypothetical protein PHV32_06800 [Eubacteriales bacterium]|nr:hypothetical protein [Eubacteriales bacterium]
MGMEICKWKHDAASPVLLMVDDLSNTWVDLNSNGTVDFGEDWGFAGNEKNSSFRYLCSEILESFPQVKVTFFIPVGRRAPVSNIYNMPYYSEAINNDGAAAAFLKSVGDDERFEAAFHGTTHGIPSKEGRITGKRSFVQEWEGFGNLAEAVDTINRGKCIFRDVFGRYPSGGKCPGYEKGRFLNDSIIKTGFKWWCGAVSLKGIKGCDVRALCEGVLDIPTTLTGDYFNSVLGKRRSTPKGLASALLKPVILNKKIKRLEQLLEKKLVISIQEHIAFSRTDRKRQKPNIFDDRESLLKLLEFLNDKDVWYCTASELNAYCRLRDNARFEFLGSQFRCNYAELNRKKILNPRGKDYREGVTNEISIRFPESWIEIILPDGRNIRSEKNGSFAIPVMEGSYTVSFIEGGPQNETCYTYI